MTRVRGARPRARGVRALAALFTLLLAPAAASADLESFQFPSLLSPLPAVGPKDSLSDDGTEEIWSNAVDVGFDFEWQGTSYRSVTISSHGALSFVRDCGRAAPAASCMDTPPRDLDFSDEPDVYLAPWWGDLDVIRGSTRVRHQTTGVRPDRVFTVEWERAFEGGPGDGTSVPYTFQVKLHESVNVATLQYGVAGAGSHDASVRFGAAGEAAAGAPVEGATFLACATSCGPADFPGTQAILVPTPQEAELVPWVRASAVSAGVADLSLTVHASLFNAGRADASGASARVYLSTDRDIAAGDIHLEDADQDGVAISAGGLVERDASVTVARPRDGLYYLGIVGSLPGEAIPGNDVQSAPEPIVLGKDILGAVASDVVQTGPGETVPVHITLQNRGTDDTPDFTYRLYLSRGARPGAGDPVLLTDMAQLDGQDALELDVDVTMPANVEGTWRFLLELDSPGAGVVAEVVEDNNVAVGPEIAVDPPDLALVAVELAGDPAEVYFGLPVEAEITVMNVGRWPARGFFVALKASGSDGFVSPRDATVWQAPEDCRVDPCAGVYAGRCDTVTFACEPSCGPTAACPDRLTCEDGACAAVLLPGETRTYRVTGVVPDRDGVNGAPLKPGPCTFGALADPQDLLFEGNAGNGDNQEDLPPRGCRYPAPDAVGTELLAPSRGAAGESLAVFRTVRNAGNAAGTLRYTYVLSENDIVSRHDLVLPIEGRGEQGEVELAPGQEDQRMERLLLPPNLAPVEGGYLLGLIVDPGRQIDELREDDNVTVAAERLDVSQGELHILGEAPPTAIVQAPYAFQLRATGGNGELSWSLSPASSPLPDGLDLERDGRLVGVLMAAALERAGVSVPGHVVFTAQAASGGARAERTFAVPVVHASGPLTIETGSCLREGDPDCARRLPHAMTGGYRAGLAASGGHPPYTWEVLAPEGFEVEGALLTGTPPPRPEVIVQVRVRDSLGVSVGADLRLKIVEPRTLRILTGKLEDADVGVAYVARFDAQGGNELTRRWEIPAADLPPGLTYESGMSCLISGTPTTPGTYTFPVTVSDGDGNSHRSMFAIVVRAGAAVFTIVTDELPRAHRGEVYEAQLRASAAEVTWRLFSGVLPAGLELAPDGLIFGTVARDARAGAYALGVEAQDGAGARVSRVVALGVAAPRVEPRYGPWTASPGSGGCGCGAGGRADPALLLALAALLRRGKARGGGSWRG